MRTGWSSLTVVQSNASLPFDRPNRTFSSSAFPSPVKYGKKYAFVSDATGAGCTCATRSRVTDAAPTVTVAVRVTFCAGCPAAGRVTMPSGETTDGAEEDHATVAALTEVGSVRFSRVSSMCGTVIAAAAARASEASSRGSTVTGNARVVETPLRLTVAVSVTSAGAVPSAGRVTLPASLTIAGFELAHAIADWFCPLVGRVTSSVTFARSPRSMAAASAATASRRTVPARVVTSPAASARS